MKKFTIALCALALLVGCSRIETGHIGVRYDWNGNVEMTPLDVGWHQTMIGHFYTYAANEMTLEITNLHPQTKDRSLIKDLDLTYTYSVAPAAIPGLTRQFSGRDLYFEKSSVWYPAGLYLNNILTTAAADVLAKYDALDANNSRETIRGEIITRAKEILKEEKLDDRIQVHQVFIKSLQVADSILASAQRVINSQNDVNTKANEVKTAQLEADRLNALSKNTANIAYMNAKANADIAEGVLQGKVHTIVIPYNFNGMMNLPSK